MKEDIDNDVDDTARVDPAAAVVVVPAAAAAAAAVVGGGGSRSSSSDKMMDSTTTTTNNTTTNTNHNKHHGGYSLPPPTTSIGKKIKSTLSRGKLQFIKKSTRGTPWYDTEELVSVGNGLLTALQLFPMVSSSSSSGDGDPTISNGGRKSGAVGQQQQQLPSLSLSSSSSSPIDCHKLQTSLHRVAVWKGGAGRGNGTRISGSGNGGGGESSGGGGGTGSILPHAIESTALLAGILWTDATTTMTMMRGSTTGDYDATTTSSSMDNTPIMQRHDDEDRDSSSLPNTTGIFMSLNQLRNAYSSAIIRSVNGIADSYRRLYYSSSSSGVNNKTNNNNGMSSSSPPPPPSVSHCACTLAGLPAWIVDVRHDASHGAALPSVHVCRLAALEILRFWKDNYWSKVEERVWGRGHNIMDGGSGGDDDEGEGGRNRCGMYTLANDILARYQKLAFLELKSSSGSSSGGGGGGAAAARHTSTASLDLEGGGQQHHHPMRNHPLQSSCVESSASNVTTLPPSSGIGVVGSASGMLTMERSDINAEEGMISVPSLDGSDDQDNDKHVAIGTMNNDTAVPPPTTRTADNRRRQRPRRVESSDGGGGAIPWWILTDDNAPKKKKKKKKKNSEDIVFVSADKVRNNEIGTASAIPTPPPAAVATPTPRDCAMEFIRTIPIDISFSCCLRFLVWGRTGVVGNGSLSTIAINMHDYDGENQFTRGELRFENMGPALLTLPSGFVPRRCQSSEAVLASALEVKEETEQFNSSFEYLRIMYEPLLVAMTTVYPGFAPALFVHLIDSIICLEEADGDESHDKNQLDGYIQHLSRWVRYIISRAFHMHFDRSVAMFNSNEAVVQRLQQHHDHRHQAAQQNLQQDSQASSQEVGLKETSQPRPTQVDLKKRGRKKWNVTQLRFMQSPLDFSSLRDIGFPLNSVCDRLLLFHQQRRTITGRKTINSEVKRMHQYLQDIIEEKDRNLDCLEIDAPHSTVCYVAYPERCSTREEDGDRERKEYQLGLGSIATLRRGGVMKGLKVQDVELLPVSERANNMMTLEEMEVLLGSGDGEEVLIDSTCVYFPDNEQDAALFPTGLMKEDSHVIAPWTMCKSWDACAIGTMPGYPS